MDSARAKFRLVIAFTEEVRTRSVPYVEGQPWAELVEVHTMSATSHSLWPRWKKPTK